MTGRRALLVVAVAGAAIFALSFLNAWIVHDREIRGEGLRHSETVLSAWRSAAIPVLSAAAGMALATAVAATVLLARPGALPRWIMPLCAGVALALTASSLVPIGWDGHTTSIDLRPGLLAFLGTGLAIAMVAGAFSVADLPRARLMALAGVGLVFAGLAVGIRWTTLTLGAPSNQAWQDGTYVRMGNGVAELTLTVDDGTYRIGDRWAGTWEGSGGWTVVLDDDPACPDSRGAYHAHGEGAEDTDLRFVKIVDTCLDGERAAILEAGIWRRQP